MKLISGGSVVTLSGDNSILHEGGVLFEEDEILEVAPASELEENHPEAEIIDAENCLIMPGLINSHMHLYSTFARGMDLKTEEPPANFTEILEKLWWRLDKTLTTREDLYYSAVSALLEGLKCGTTTIFDHHASYGNIEGSLDVLKQAVEDVGLRAGLCFEVSDRHGEEKARKSLEENADFIESLGSAEKNYLAGHMGLHASFTLEDATLKRAGELAEELGVPCHLHVAEGRADVDDSRRRGYDGIVKRLDKFGIWRPGTLAVHGVHLNEDEFKHLARRDCYLIHNPQSNMSNAVGTADIEKARDMGLKIGLGTDGYTSDMWETLTAADLLPSHKAGDPRAGSGIASWMLFEVNRELAGEAFSRPAGVLEKGAGADIIIIDYSPPTPLNRDTLASHLLMGISSGDIRDVIARGKTVVREREVQTLDHGEITRKCREQAEDLWQRF